MTEQVNPQDPETCNPQPLTTSVWEDAGGVECPQCHRETLRMLQGLCPACSREQGLVRAATLGDLAERRYYKSQLRKGAISMGELRENRLGT